MKRKKNILTVFALMVALSLTAIPVFAAESENTDSDGSAFYIAGGSTVTFTVKLKSSAHVVMGYKDSDGNMIQTYNGTRATNTTSISIANTGNYKFYLTNVSDSTINITGGSITF